MSKNLTEIMAKLPSERQQKIEARANELIVKYKTNKKRRKAHQNIA